MTNEHLSNLLTWLLREIGLALGWALGPAALGGLAGAGTGEPAWTVIGLTVAVGVFATRLMKATAPRPAPARGIMALGTHPDQSGEAPRGTEGDDPT